MKKYPVISTCPVCDHELKVAKLVCDHCGTTIDGDFTLSKFNYLDSDKLYFIEIFVKNRGNIKAIEKELNISYPTVKKMLDDVIVGLGYSLSDDSEDDEEKVSNQETLENGQESLSKVEILARLSKKEITAEEAVQLLKKTKK